MDTAVVVVPGALEVIPPFLDFGVVAVGSVLESSVIVRNTGGSPLTITAAGLVDTYSAFGIDPATGLTLEAGAQQTLHVAFAPMYRMELFQADAWFETPAEPHAMLAEMVGRTPDPDIRITPAVHDFGVVDLHTVQVVELLIENVGIEELTVHGLEYTSTHAPSMYLEDDGPFVTTRVPPGASIEALVAFVPVEYGGFEGTLTVLSDDPDEAEAVAVQAGIASCECPEGWQPSLDGLSCEHTVEEPATFVGEKKEICPIAGNWVYGRFGAKYPDGFNARDPYWGQDDGFLNGRLNAIGVWECLDGGTTAGHVPIDEWVGFQVCMTNEEDGAYLIGMGADNQFRMVVDGVTLLEKTVPGKTSTFNYWWMQPIELEAGEHIVELWGLNEGSIAAFGAEISGPFDPALLTDGASMDALPHASKIVWNTAATVGESFEIGDGVGWHCPHEGMVLDFCEEEPTCSHVEVLTCEELASP
jgi:hypothetical protein